MNTAVMSRYEIDVEDIEYLRHGDKPLLARVFTPRGDVKNGTSTVVFFDGHVSRHRPSESIDLFRP